MKRALPLLALAVAVGVVVLLVGSGGRSRKPAPEPDVSSTTTTTVRTSALSRWKVPAGTRATSVIDLERHHAVLQVSPRDPATSDGAGVFDDVLVDGTTDRTVRFRASVQVVGPGRAGLFLRARSFEGTNRRDVPDLAAVVTPDDDLVVGPGGWQRLSVELVVPEGTAQLLYGVSIDGGGSVLVDDADDL